jgi:hypothetical protein
VGQAISLPPAFEPALFRPAAIAVMNVMNVMNE